MTIRGKKLVLYVIREQMSGVLHN